MKRKTIIATSNTNPRRGAVLIFAMMAMLVGSMLIVALMRTASLTHRTLKQEEIRLQANQLADAGCSRLIRLLQKNPEFTDEAWTVPPEQLEPGRTATVRMKVSTDTAKPNRKLAKVEVEYPVGHPDLVRITREIPLP